GGRPPARRHHSPPPRLLPLQLAGAPGPPESLPSPGPPDAVGRLEPAALLSDAQPAAPPGPVPGPAPALLPSGDRPLEPPPRPLPPRGGPLPGVRVRRDRLLGVSRAHDAGRVGRPNPGRRRGLRGLGGRADPGPADYRVERLAPRGRARGPHLAAARARGVPP